MDNPPATPARIVELTLDTMDDCTSALESIIQENWSPGSSPRSTSVNAVLLDVDIIATRLRTLSFEAQDALRVSALHDANERAPLVQEVHVHSADEDSSIGGDVVPMDYDPVAEENTPEHEYEQFDSDGLPYDSDDSGKYL